MARHDQAVQALRADLGAKGLHAARTALVGKLASLAARDRFEEAAAHRDAFAELVRVVDRARRLGALREAGLVRLRTPEGPVELRDGRLAATEPPPAEPPGRDAGLALSASGLGERQAVATWLARAEQVRIEACERPWSSPWPRVSTPDRIDLDMPGSLERPQQRGVSGLE